MKYDFLYDRIKEGRKILFDKDDECLRPLQEAITNSQRATLILWSLELAKETVELLENIYPNVKYPRDALMTSWLYTCGFKDISQAKKAVMSCHLATANACISNKDTFHFHAVSEACKVAYDLSHSIQYPRYELTSIVLKYGVENCESFLDERIHHYENTLIAISSKDAVQEIERTKSILRQNTNETIKDCTKNVEMNIVTNKEIFDRAVKDIETLIGIKNKELPYVVYSSSKLSNIFDAIDHAIEAIRSNTAFKFYNFAPCVGNSVLEVLISSYVEQSKEYTSAGITIKSDDEWFYSYTGDDTRFRYPEFAMIKYLCDKYNMWNDENNNFQLPSNNK